CAPLGCWEGRTRSDARLGWERRARSDAPYPGLCVTNHFRSARVLPSYTPPVNRLFTPFLRRVYVLAGSFVIVYAAFWFGQYTSWNKERLYRKLLAGNREERKSAAFDLVWLGGQDQLLRALKSDSEPVRMVAIDSLWTLWFHAAGRDAFRRA